MGRGGNGDGAGPAIATRGTKVDPDSCVLRGLRPGDLEVISTWLDDEAIKNYAGGESAIANVEDPICDSVVLVDSRDRVVGFATIEPCINVYSPMVLLATDPALRGQGLGVKLFEELAAWGRENDEFGLVYGEVNAENTACIRAAESAGWHEVEKDGEGYLTLCSGSTAGLFEF